MSAGSWSAALLAGLALAGLAARSQLLSSLPSAERCFGLAAQWMVALLGLCLYPALRRTGTVGSSSNKESSGRPCGPGSHSIQLEHVNCEGTHARGSSTGFFKRLRRLLSDGRSQARRLCGRDSLQAAVSNFSRKRSSGSRSSKSEDVLSSRLSMDSVLRAAHQNAGGGGSRRGLLQRKPSGSRWQPSMSRIASGQHLPGLAPSVSSLSSATGGKRLEILSYNGFQAVDCMSHELTDTAFRTVRQVVTDTHLLQFGALIGEASAQLALSQAGSVNAVGAAPASLFGPYDRREQYGQGWELIVEEHRPGLHYWNWRRHLRRGLYMYKSKTVYEAATTAQIVGFTYDIEFRRTWDDTSACQVPIPPPPAADGDGIISMAEADAKGAGGKSAFMYAKTKFPPPMASREYVYARRCWAKPDDGGCYCISRACTHPSPPAACGRTVRVNDFVSGYVVRSGKGVFDAASPAVEVINVYFEDPCVPSGIANMSVRRALWPMVQKAEAAFRDYLLTRVHGGLEHPPPERAVALDSLGAAMGAGGARAAAAAADADAASCLGALPHVWRLSLKLGSPYLLYRGYMAVCRGGRAAVLAALSCCMSLWCNATGLFVRALEVARSGLRVTAAAAKAALAAAAKRLQAFSSAGLQAAKRCAAGPADRKIRLLARIMWPWEAVLRRGPWHIHGISSVTSSGLQRTASGGDSSASGDRLSSHPLPSNGGAPAPKRLSFAPSVSGGGAGGGEDAQSPRGGVRRVRGGFARRCALLAVKVAKVAGAGLLLGRAARADGGTQDTAASGTQLATATIQAARVQHQKQQKQQTSNGGGRAVVPGKRW